MRKLGTALIHCIAVLTSAGVIIVTGGGPSDAATHRTDPTVRPCKSEDSVTRCVWDARHRGNGIGHSFTVWRNGSVHYVSHHHAHQLATAYRKAH